MKLIPFGDRILCKRRKVGEKIGNLYLSENMADSNTDIADVVYVPDLTFGDKYILDNAEKIISSLIDKATKGDDHALIAAMKMNEFVRIKSLKEGDCIMLSRYVGVDFMDNSLKQEMTLCKSEDIIAVVVKDEEKK